MLAKLVALGIAIIYAVSVIFLSTSAKLADLIDLTIAYAAMIAACWIAVASLFMAKRIWRDGTRSIVVMKLPDAQQFLPLLVFAITMAAFTLFKQTLLTRAGFGFGPRLAEFEYGMLGRDAWRITHAWFASAGWSQAIDIAYHCWFAPMTLGMVLCSFASKQSLLAQRYIIAFVLVWIVEGSIVAYLFPAAGPCFYGYFQSDPDRFADITRLLRSQDSELTLAGLPGLSALHYQAELYRTYQSHSISVGGGISAMPSLHNAMAVLFACAALRCSTALGVTFTGYAVIIAIGSVHLGWHYATDGIAAGVATITLWKIAGVMTTSIDHIRTPLTPVESSTAALLGTGI